MTKLQISAVFAILLSIANAAFAADITVKVTPVKTITTAKKNAVQEGDYIDFKVIEDTKILKKGDIVTGIVTFVEENGFTGKEAEVLIEEFRSGNVFLHGDIYLHGNVHKKLNEFVDCSFSGFPVIMRGGEVIVRPDSQNFLLYIKE